MFSEISFLKKNEMSQKNKTNMQKMLGRNEDKNMHLEINWRNNHYNINLHDYSTK